MTKNITIIVVGILLIINILLVMFCYKLSKNSYLYSIRDEKDIEKILSHKTDFLADAFVTNLLNDNIDLNGQQKVLDIKKNKYNLQDIILDKQTLIVRFSDMNCHECVNFMLTKIKRMSAELNMENHIILIATYQNVRELSIYTNQLEINCPIYLTDSLSIPCEQNNFPYWFILDSSLKTHHVFIPDKAEPKIANTYLRFIKNRYFKLENE